MKSIAEINAIKAKMQKELGARDNIEEGDIRIVVGMATCGIAAGARPVINAFADEIAKRGVRNVKVTQTGCLGMCKLEPMAQIYTPGAKEPVTYVFLNPEKARRIVLEHVVNGAPVKEYTIEER